MRIYPPSLEHSTKGHHSSRVVTSVLNSWFPVKVALALTGMIPPNELNCVSDLWTAAGV
jgi:hypothetical protein